MNIGFMACIVLGVLFLIVGILFSLLKEKGANAFEESGEYSSCINDN